MVVLTKEMVEGLNTDQLYMLLVSNQLLYKDYNLVLKEFMYRCAGVR